MSISVTIPTLNREKDLRVLFDSILKQNKKPNEIIVVDQSDSTKTRDLCNNYKLLGIKYFHIDVKSSTHSRNIGIKKATSEIIAFLDDDTSLSPDYFEQVEEFFQEHPNAIGGMGKIINQSEISKKIIGVGYLNGIYRLISSFFLLNSNKNGFLVLPSGRNTIFFESKKTINVKWLSGATSFYKKSIFKEFQFEEKFMKWAFGEDKMFSYQIQKKYPNSLYYYPKAKLYHFESSANRLIGKENVFLKTIYQFWFFHKCIDKSYFYYFWGNLGEIFLHFFNACLLRESFLNTFYYVQANIYLLKNLRSIKNGNLNEFFEVDNPRPPSQFDISVIIPTLDREKDLRVLFDSILKQNKKPNEIIVVDQSDSTKTKDLCHSYVKNGLNIKYIHSDVKSCPYSRNVGLKQANCDIISFLDDDTSLLPDYFEQIDEFFQKYPDAIGGMSNIINHSDIATKTVSAGFLNKIYKLVSTFFFLNSFRNDFLVLPSGRNTTFFESTKPIKTDWLSGLSFYKKTIFDEFQFEEKFMKWAFGEDKMFSYQIQKKYPNSLYYYPKAKLYHFESSSNRLIGKEKIFLKTIYQFWFFHKCIEKSDFYYFWGNLGEIFLHFFNACLLRESFLNTFYYVQANIYLLKNLRSIKNGNLNEFLK